MWSSKLFLLILGGVTQHVAAALSDQQPLGQPNLPNSRFGHGIDKLSEWKGDAASLIDELHRSASTSAETLEEMISRVIDDDSKTSSKQSPKPQNPNRRPDSEWDHITYGRDVPSAYAAGDADFDTYALRVKELDRSILGVDDVKQYTGYFDNEAEDKHLFFWFLESRNDPANDPVVLWVTGGPGCSSMVGLFMELGPARITQNIKVVRNDFSWNSNASILFIDQPVNTGFSYSSNNVYDSVTAARDVYSLLTLFFGTLTQYASQPFFISGESYAGHFVPSFAHEIFSHDERNINLAGITIGNGLVNPRVQYGYYLLMACGGAGTNYGPIVDSETCGAMNNSMPRCLALMDKCAETRSHVSCLTAGVYCNNALLEPYRETGYNVYDMRIKCADPENRCYREVTWLAKYLNQPKVSEALGSEIEQNTVCNNDIHNEFLFQGDWARPFDVYMPSLLERIPVLVYAGDVDFVCNWLGNDAWTRELNWEGKNAFNLAEMQPLKLDGDNEYGQVRSSGNLTFMRIYEAGHMVPMDQPQNSLDMFNRWLGGEWA